MAANCSLTHMLFLFYSPRSSQSEGSSLSSDYNESDSSSTSQSPLPRINKRVVASAKANKSSKVEKKKVSPASNKKLLFKNERCVFILILSLIDD